ncbi:MAG: TIGR04013 family B12-binding domain/radical SAM domain-containing protein [Deltaproteobacteria bacterium]|nr:TIGR04013 family B12-binding domain/radical SAM domain-containing protein [Deltaproteobacteria bacterium]
MTDPRVALVMSHRFPGKYAFTVLAGALEREEDTGQLGLHFARDREGMVAAARAAQTRGERVVLAWSFYSPGFPEAATDLAWVRAQLAGIDVLCIAGGVHATAEPLETLQAGFDLVAVGEGEKTIVELVRRLRVGESWHGVPGTARLEEGALRSHGKGELATLDDWPPFAVRHDKFGAIEITRGCIYACKFCQTPFVSKARFRHRSIENIVGWAKKLRATGRRDLRFLSPTSLSYGSPDETPNLEAVDALLARCREAIGPEGRIYFGTFPSELRPEHVTPEALAVLKKWVDNDNLIIGGQSGSERVLAQSHRGHDVESIVRAARISVECGFLPNVDFILGLPGEEQADIEATLALMERLAEIGAKVHGHTFMPLPGTPFKRAPPGQVDDATREKLDRLASQGRLYGQWKRQQAVAAEMAERRDRRRPPA